MCFAPCQGGVSHVRANNFCHSSFTTVDTTVLRWYSCHDLEVAAWSVSIGGDHRGHERERGLALTLTMWPKNAHLANMRASGHFRFICEVSLHAVEHGDAARYLAMMQSNAFSNQFQFTEQELGLDRFTEALFHYIGSEPVPWYVSYHVRIGVK